MLDVDVHLILLSCVYIGATGMMQRRDDPIPAPRFAFDLQVESDVHICEGDAEPRPCSELSTSANEVGCELGNTVDRGLDVSRDVERDDRGVHYADVRRAVHDELVVHHTALLAWQHRASAQAVILRRGRVADELGHVALHTGDDLLGNVARVLGGVCDRTQVLCTGDRDLQVVVVLVVPRHNQRGALWAGRVDVDVATREQVLLSREEGDVVLARLRRARRGEVAVNTDQLHLRDGVRVLLQELDLLVQSGAVRRLDGRHVLLGGGNHAVGLLCADEGLERDVGDRRHSLGEDRRIRVRVLRVQGLLLGCEGRIVAKAVECDMAILKLESSAGVRVILEVLSDSGKVNQGPDASSCEDVLVSNARQLENLGRVHNTGRNNDFASDGQALRLTASHKRDRLGAVVAEEVPVLVEVDLGDCGVEVDLEVGARRVGKVVRHRAVRTRRVDGVDVTGLDRGTDVVAGEGLLVVRQAECLERRDPVLDLLRDPLGEGDLDGPRRAVVGADGPEVQLVLLCGRGSGELLGLAHVLVHAVPVPALVAQLLPSVVFLLASAIPHQEVERRATAEKLAARPVLGGSLGTRLGEELVVVICHQIRAELAGNVDNANVEAAGTGLDDSDRVMRVFTQTSGYRQTSRTTSDDNVVEVVQVASPSDIQTGRAVAGTGSWPGIVVSLGELCAW